MSGHSKWSTIKRKKGALDQKRSKIFGKLIREISVAARLGGPDPESNARLRAAVATARTENMPMENIKRAIEKVTGSGAAEDYVEVVYEGYGPSGAAILIDVMTDNKNRTAGEIRHIFTRHGGNLGSSNCVAWMFERKAYISVDKSLAAEDRLMEIGLEAGADDIKDGDDVWEIYSAPEKFEAIMQALEKAKINTVEAKIAKVPENITTLSEKDADKLMNLLDALEDLDDVQNVWSNFDIAE
jgi:YebC/PmpR family DNA-binding regulatory protein